MVFNCTFVCVKLLILSFSCFQLKDLLVRTMESWVNLFDENNKDNLPILKMELTFDEERMQFYPPYEDLEEVALFVVDQITKSMQQVPTVQSWLAGGNTTVNTDVIVAQHIVDASTFKLKEACQRNFEEPQLHLQSFSK
jgi:dynein heavy chain